MYIYIYQIYHMKIYETAMTQKTIFRFQLLVFMRITFALGAFLLEPSQGLEQHPWSRCHGHRLHHRQRARASRFWRLTAAHRWSAEGASETKQPGSPGSWIKGTFLMSYYPVIFEDSGVLLAPHLLGKYVIPGSLAPPRYQASLKIL